MSWVSEEASRSSVDVAVGHSDSAEILLALGVTSSREVSDGTTLCSLRALAASVGVNFSIHNEDIDIVARSDNVIEATIADIVSPAITTDDPDSLLGEDIGLLLKAVDFNILAIESKKLRLDFFSKSSRFVEVVPVGKEILEFASKFTVEGVLLEKVFDEFLSNLTASFDSMEDTITEFGVIFEEGVSPCWTVALFVDSVWVEWIGGGPNKRAASSIGNVKLITIELGDELDNGWFTTSWASTVEFKKGWLELGAFDSELLSEMTTVWSSNAFGVFGILFVPNIGSSDHLEGLGWASSDTNTTALAVVARDGDLELEVLEASSIESLHALGFFGSEEEWTDDTVWAHDGAGVALDTFLSFPLWNFDSNLPLLEFGGGVWKSSTFGNFINSDFVAALFDGGLDDLVNASLGLKSIDWELGVEPGLFVVFDFMKTFDGFVNSKLVLGNDIGTLALVLLGNGILKKLLVLLFWKDLGKVEEGGLHEHVDTAGHTNGCSNLGGINGINFGIKFSKTLLEGWWEGFVEVGTFWNVDNKLAALLEWLDHVELLEVGWVVASNVISTLDKVWCINWLLTKTKVGSSDTTRLVGIIGKVGLAIKVGVGDDELDGLLVGTNSTIGTKTPEDALLGGGWKVISWLANFKSGLWLWNADSEVVLWSGRLEVLDNGIDMLWSKVFRTDTITTTNSKEVAFAVKTRNNISEEWFVGSCNFVDLVHNADSLDGGWKDIVDEFGWEWAVKVDLENANLVLWVGLDVFFDGVAARAHEDDGGFIVLGTNILEWFVVTAGEFAISLHGFFELVLKFVEALVWFFDGLPNIVWWENGTTNGWVFWVHGAKAHLLDGLFVNKLVKVGVGNFLVGVDFVGGTETIEEVDEWKARLDGGEVSNSTKIVCFLDTIGAEHWHASGAGSIDIAVIVVDGKTTKSEGTGSNVENTWAVFSSNLVKIWDHKKKTLRCGERSAEGTSGGSTVESSGSTTFGLHHAEVDWVTPNVLAALGNPSIDKFTHSGSWGDWVNE